MKWFKHLSCSFHDEKLSKVIDELGLEGYGFWWRLLEVIAEELDETGNTKREFSAKKWGNFFGISAKKFEKMVKIFQKFEIFSVKFSENGIEIDIPNLMKYKDNWTKDKASKQGKTCKSLARVDKDIDIDKDIDKDKEKYKRESGEKSPQQTVKVETPLPDEYLQLSQKFQDIITANQGGCAPKVTDKLIRDGASAVDKAIRIDGFALDELKRALWWATQDTFWSSNLLSLAQLRRKTSNGTSRVQTIISQYRKSLIPKVPKQAQFESRYEREQREKQESFAETIRILDMMDGNEKGKNNGRQQADFDFIDTGSF